VNGAYLLSVLMILGGLVVGCADDHPAPLSAASNAAEFESRSFDDPRLRDFVLASLAGEPGPAPDRGPTWNLTTLTLAAIYFHPDLDIARAKLELSRAATVTAGQRPNPVLNLGTAFDTAAVAGAIPPGAIPLTIGPVINLIVETFGKRGYRAAEARQLAEASRWDLATAAWQVRGRVRTALLDLWAASRRVGLNRRKLELQEQVLRLLERRLEVGEASSLDVSRERINLARVAVALRDIERAADQASAQLATAVGVPVHVLPGARLSFDAFDRAQPLGDELAEGALRRQALTERTDVRAALAQYEAAQSVLQLQVANQYPNLTLGPGYNYDVGVNKFSITPALELPIFHQNQGQIAEAAARRQQSAARLTALQAQIVGAIDAAVAAYHATARELKTTNGLLAGAQRREREIAASFRAGEVDRPTLISAELETASIRLLRFDAVFRRHQAMGALEDALQRVLYEPAAIFSVPQTSPRLASEPSP
jgi:outer membrane protein, heavy metal efflux system